MEDLINRQAAIDLLLLAIDDSWESDYAEARMRELPSAQPERKRGTWHHYEGAYTCNECGATLEESSPFCPMCGADMRGEENSMDDLISRQAAIDAIESTDWYHIGGGELVHGANSKEDEPLYKAKDIYSVFENLPSAQSEIIQCKDCKFSHMTINGECKYCDIWFPDEKCYVSGDYYCGSAERSEE